MIIINDEFLKEGKMEGQLKRIKEKFMTSIMPDRVLEKVIREHYPKWTDSQIKRTVKVFSSQRTKALEKSLKRRKHF